MTDGLLTWSHGTLQSVTCSEWAGVVASFLGAGFRVDLPAGDRSSASAYEKTRVDRLAELLGHSRPEEVWALVASSYPDQPVEILGGWPRSYRSEDDLQVAVRAIDENLQPTSAAILTISRHPAPTDGLPTLSQLGDQMALRAIDAEVGLWLDPAGRIVTSTAGPVLAQRSDGSWAMGSESETWLARRLMVERAADRRLTIHDVESATSLGVVRRALGIQVIRLAAPTD